MWTITNNNLLQLKRYENNPILKSAKNNFWESGSVFNPGAIIGDDGKVHLVYRAIPEGFRKRAGRNFGPGGAVYENYVSSIGHAVSDDGVNFSQRRLLFKPRYEWERFGCEDPRVTKFKDSYFIFYTAMNAPAFSWRGNRIGLATTKDFEKIEKHGIVGPNIESKAAALFPELINGKVAMLFMVEEAGFISQDKNPFIVIAYFDSIEQLFNPPVAYWEEFISSINDHKALTPTQDWQSTGVETGAPPIKTNTGWLQIYAGIKDWKSWWVGAALLDLKDPQKIIARTVEPLLKAETDYELKGDVPNVTFPAGAVIKDGKIYLYYGAADSTCCLATADLDVLC